MKGSFGEPRDKATKVEFGSEATRPEKGLEGIFGAAETTQREEIQILSALEEQVRESSNRNWNQPAAVFGTTCSTAEPPQSSERIRDEDLPDTQRDPFDQSIAMEPSLNTQFWAEINKKTEGNHRDPTTSLLINFTAQHSNNFNTDTCENSNQSIPQYSNLNRQNSDQLALNEQLDYTGSSATQSFALAHQNIKELLRERLESPGRSSASESPGFSSQHLVHYLPDTQKDPSDLPSHSTNWTAENFNQVVPETHVSCATPSFFAKQDSPLFASLSGLHAPIEASRKLSCRERKRLIVPLNRPVNVTSAMKAWATRTFYSLDPFREDEDCWFHPVCALQAKWANCAHLSFTVIDNSRSHHLLEFSMEMVVSGHMGKFKKSLHGRITMASIQLSSTLASSPNCF